MKSKALYLSATVVALIFMLFTFFENFNSSALQRLFLLLLSSVLYYLGSRVYLRDKCKREYCVMRRTFIIFFVMYIVFLVDLVLFDRSFGRNGFLFIFEWNSEDVRYYIENKVNLRPFKTIALFFNPNTGAKRFVVNIIGNLTAFAPFGFFLPLLFVRINNVLRLTLAVATTVTAVELLQFIMQVGSCDIDDLILNTLGALILYLILKIPVIRRLINRFTLSDGEKQQQ